MTCYRSGGCGPYENRSCYECPASKPEYIIRAFEDFDTKKVEAIQKEGVVYIIPTETKPIKVVIENDWIFSDNGEFEVTIQRPLTETEKQALVELIKSL